MKQLIKLSPIRQQFNVAFAYDVHFTSGLFRIENALLANIINADGQETTAKMLIVIDDRVVQCHSNLLRQIEAYAKANQEFQLMRDPIEVPGGEQCKNTSEFLTLILKVINEFGLCRHSYVLAIGGGAVLDMVGYAAALAHRGIRLIRVPTTVLSQCDSGVGVKNGINAFGKKNFLGTFAPPYAVLNDFEFLTTLENRDWRSGLAEAVKVALIKDESFFDYIESHVPFLVERDSAIAQQVIYRCAQMHLEHISGHNDPFEHGSSRPLDFGHWSAHKLEQLTHHELRHGEAVAIGIALDSAYSFLSGMLPGKALERILTILEKLGFQLYVQSILEEKMPDSTLSLFEGLKEFREHLGGPLTLMLLKEIGQGVNVYQVDESLYLRAIYMLKER